MDIHIPVWKVKRRIKDLEKERETLDRANTENLSFHERVRRDVALKLELNELFEIRKIQKKRGQPTPKKTNFKKGL